MFTYCLNNPLVFEDSAGAAARICISADGTIDDAPWRDYSPGGGGRPYKEYHYQPNKYGDAADKFYTVRFFRALGNGVKMLTGANRIRGIVSKIKEGAQLLFVPFPTVAEDLAGMALIVYGIIDLARGITEFIIGADGE